MPLNSIGIQLASSLRMFAHPPPQLEEIHAVAERISRYLQSRPNAMDSLEGILSWWLLKQQVEESAGVVKSAMEYLVSLGVVEQVESAGKNLYVCRGPDNSDESESESVTDSQRE